MGMFSEIATEGEVEAYCKEVERLLTDTCSYQWSPDAIKALKMMGRFALTRFEWTTPEWAAKYAEMFKD